MTTPRPFRRPRTTSENSTIRRSSRTPIGRSVEILEDRRLPASFAVTSLAASGEGTLRWAIQMANAHPGADEIDFEVAGTINLNRKASLPAITDRVTIDGSSAPTFAGSPVVTVNFQGTKGVRFAAGSDGSTLTSLSIVKAGNAGVTLEASRITVQGNYIGLLANGSTVAGNRGDGVTIAASSHDNLIGRVDPVTDVTYYNTDSVSIQPVTGWQGIRASSVAGNYLISGTSGSNGLLYDGPISGQGGTSYLVNYPGAATTSVYGPDLLSDGSVRLVGSYRTGEDTVSGFVFQGTTAELTDASHYQSIAYPGAQFTYVHSTMGDLAVGNYDSSNSTGAPLDAGHAFIYNLATSTFVTDVVYPGSVSNTAYGIWDNGRSHYTIVGGTTLPATPGRDTPLGMGYMVDYDATTGVFSNWKTFAYPDGPAGVELLTHFEGISSVEDGVYTLAGMSAQIGGGAFSEAALVTVKRNADGTFGDGTWVTVKVPGASGITTSDAVMGNQVVGIAASTEGTVSYQATVNTAYQLSNVISGNGGEGIGVYGSNNNRIATNYIGTDMTGTQKRGNGRNGILITNGARGNMIGGTDSGGNDPTAGVIVRPPQGNLISGNRANGVLITGGATGNTLSGNFVGTDASGNSALGNRKDGVAIDRADGNSLIGCTVQNSPFVYYNVLSGNGGNGLRVTNSNDITVHANFMGVGANNAVIVANGGDGLLISGSSRNTQVGGIIPLGNVISGNNRNGIEVKDRASGFVSFNTFGGVFAFGGAAPNRGDGILITSTGGNNLVRTSIISGNYGNGIELGGQATGVEITDTATGTNTAINAPIPNRGSGIKISGRAHGNAVGGYQPSIEPRDTSSANGRYGIEIVGSARDNVIYNTYIGTDARGTSALGNLLGGVYLGPGTSNNSIGGAEDGQANLIAYNLANGVLIKSARNGRVANNRIQSNAGYGLQAIGNVAVTVVRDNTIEDNALGNVDTSKATGIIVES
ncbi:beta strand repeat-containing protein [Paludisphaera rhizosphaerae]|uniref:beta strand repeat-containing protein n=1 Tax=Paludisphaera rhizosphaerae TaxID=2711216 RepID=UPI0013EA2166|nr:right-handed parallel beta-helix repeat-containing protein [Paludisphaera rhizosphaerae]